MNVVLGGDRLGAGNKNNVELKTYERSTHDYSSIFKSSMSSGTLVPFMNEIALPGDSWEIDLDCDIMTLPTLGPLFGSYKVQLDVFVSPVRLYQGALNMDLTGVGLQMDKIYLPQMELEYKIRNSELWSDGTQVNNSCIYSYFNIRGLGCKLGGVGEIIKRKFNATDWINYWNVYKQYYANKQEEIGAMIHNTMDISQNALETVFVVDGNNAILTEIGEYTNTTRFQNIEIKGDTMFEFLFINDELPSYNDIILNFTVSGENNLQRRESIASLFGNIEAMPLMSKIVCKNPIGNFARWTAETGRTWVKIYGWEYSGFTEIDTERPKVLTFPLSNIDDTLQDILRLNRVNDQYIFRRGDTDLLDPFRATLNLGNSNRYSIQAKMEGLGLKTYQSDMFNSWVNNEWTEGVGGINEITSVDTSQGNFTIASLIIANKVFNMLNRIAVSDGTYGSYISAVYTTEMKRGIMSPVYCGGLIRELAFQQVVSNASSEVNGNQQPLGTLAGRGVMTQKKKGGYIKINVDEPSVVLGLVSLTPRIDYSQGNKWNNNIRTLADLHRPQLDEIAFGDLITDGMAWFDTKVTNVGESYRSAGKVPAWLNYMTDVNRTYGNFADENDSMFMTLNRKYERDFDGSSVTIKDLTTYVDPAKYNNIFADTRRDAQNFWVQISKDIKLRRKMSSKVMPNL